jgi:hypothetical protein
MIQAGIDFMSLGASSGLFAQVNQCRMLLATNADLIVIFDILNGVIPLGGAAETQV